MMFIDKVERHARATSRARVANATGMMLLALAAHWLPGCGSPSDAPPADAGSDTGGNTDAGPTGEAQEALDEFVTAFCAAARGCCATDGFDVSALGSCEAEVRSQFELDYLVEQVEAGVVTFSTAQLMACVTDLEAIATSCDVFDVARCFETFAGTLPDGSTCTDAVQCADDAGSAACMIVSGADEGVCRQDARAALGDGCFSTCAEPHCGVTYTTPSPETTVTAMCFVSDGLVCSFPSDRCVAAGAVGDPCTVSELCEPGRYCDDDGECAQRLADGATCVDGAQCGELSDCVETVCTRWRFAYDDLCEGDFD